MSGFGAGGGFPGDGSQLPFQPGGSSLGQAQNSFLGNLTPQQLQEMLQQQQRGASNPAAVNPNASMFQQAARMPGTGSAGETTSASLPQLGAAAGAANQYAPTSALLAEMAAKAKSGLLTQSQLAQIRAIIGQQQQAQPQQRQPAPSSGDMFGNMMQGAQGNPMAQQPDASMLANQLGSQLNQGFPANAQPMRPSMSMPQSDPSMVGAKPGAPQGQDQQAHVVQAVHLVRNMQQHIRNIEQKLATNISESERQSLQRTYQELLKVQIRVLKNLCQHGGSPELMRLLQQRVAQAKQAQVQSQPQSAPLSSPFTPAMRPDAAGANMMTNASAGIPAGQSNTMNTLPGQAAPAQPQKTQPSLMSLPPDQFNRALFDLMRRHGKPIQTKPAIDGHEIDLYQLYTTVQVQGGSQAVTQKSAWPLIVVLLRLAPLSSPQLQTLAIRLAQVYGTYLSLFEQVWERAVRHHNTMAGTQNAARPPTAPNAVLGQQPRPAAPDNQGGNMPMFSSPAMQTKQTVPGGQNMGAMTGNRMPQQQTGQTNVRPQGLPFTQEQLASLGLTPQQLVQLLQQQQQRTQQQQLAARMAQPSQGDAQRPAGSTTNVSQAFPSYNVQGQQNIAGQQGMAQRQQPSAQAEQQSSGQQGSKLRYIPVSQKMLDDAVTVLKRVDAELAHNRPHLPVIQDISDEEKNKVFENVQKLVLLQATVSTLLPAFLAMNGNVEPAKRVKIMMYMLQDQLDLAPKGKCILRFSDLEKLKAQMTRCIGFVRASNNQLAQQLITKSSDTLAAQSQVLRRIERAQAKQHAGDTEDDQSRGNKKQDASVHKSELGEPHDAAAQVRDPTKGPVTRAKAFKETQTQESQGHPQATDGTIKKETRHSPGQSAARDRVLDSLKESESLDSEKKKQIDELSNNNPIAFAEKAWNELLAAQGLNTNLPFHLVEEIEVQTREPSVSLEAKSQADLPTLLGELAGGLKPQPEHEAAGFEIPGPKDEDAFTEYLNFTQEDHVGDDLRSADPVGMGVTDAPEANWWNGHYIKAN